MTAKDLNSSEYDSFYNGYIGKLSGDTELRKGFELGKQKVLHFFQSIPKEKLSYRYAEDKWSVKEVFQHLIDTERIFMYRCFRISRNDDTALAGYDQDFYIKPSDADSKSIESLLEEYNVTRDYSSNLLNSLTDINLKHVGNSNGGSMSGRAAAFTILGHEIWHIEVIKNKYL
jgi:hypothetical protein